MENQNIPLLKFEIDDSEMLQNSYSVLKLKITNVGEIEAKDINIKLQIEVDKTLSHEATASNYPQLEEIKPNESKVISFGFMPTIAGKVSLTIISSCKSVSGKNLPEKKERVSVTIRPEISKPKSIVNIGNIVKDSTEISDSVINKSDIYRIKYEIERREIERDRSEREQGIDLLTKMKAAKRADAAGYHKIENDLKAQSSASDKALIKSIGEGRGANSAVRHLGKLARMKVAKGLTHKQILALQAKDSVAVAKALEAKYGIEKSEIIQNTMNVCHSCKDFYPPDYHFCPKCGRDFQRKKTNNISCFCKILFCNPMCLQQEFPLSVYISQMKEEIEKIKDTKRLEKSIEKPINIKFNQKKFLELKLISAACYISPETQKIYFDEKINSADFKIAPRITGPFVIEIEIYYENEKIKDIPIPIQIQDKPIEMPLGGITTIRMTEKQVVYFSIIGTIVTILSMNFTANGLLLFVIILSLFYILWKRRPTNKIQSESIFIP